TSGEASRTESHTRTRFHCASLRLRPCGSRGNGSRIRRSETRSQLNNSTNASSRVRGVFASVKHPTRSARPSTDRFPRSFAGNNPNTMVRVDSTSPRPPPQAVWEQVLWVPSSLYPRARRTSNTVGRDARAGLERVRLRRRFVCAWNQMASINLTMAITEYTLPEGVRPRRLAIAADDTVYFTDFKSGH